MDRIEQIAQELVRKYETHNPFRIAQEKGILVMEESLGNEIYGYYNYAFNIRMIHINRDLTEEMKRFTCAHELGHAVLHTKENTPRLSLSTITSAMKIEAQANRFATSLLIDGRHTDQGVEGVYNVLTFYGLPKEMDRFVQKTSYFEA